METLKGLKSELAKPIDKVLYTRDQINQRVAQLGEEITRDYQGKDLLVICVLKGSLYFTADLIRQIKVPLSLDFMAVSSYGQSTRTSGIARITKDLDEDIEGRHVIIIEDILDTGLTLDYLIKVLSLRNPADIKICTFLNKPSRRVKKDIVPHYVGYEIPELFVVGYGMDYEHRYRHLPFICTFKPEYVPQD